MSKEQPQNANAGPREREPVPVKILRFQPGNPVDLPGKGGANAIVTTVDARPGQARHVVEYLPWMRHHRVTYHPAGGEKPLVAYVHETWGSWESP